MKKVKRQILALVLTIALLLSSTAITVSAVTYTVGHTLGTGTITSAENRNLTVDGDVTYAKAIYTDSGSRQQAIYTLEFNPTASNYMPYVYSRWTGTGSDVYRSALQAESQFGANVIAGINANFYSTATGSTYAGYWVHDGRLAQATLGYNHDIITFNSDGQVNIVNSKLDFKVYHNGSEIKHNNGSSLVHINKKSTSATVDNRFYYWDTECGTRTDSVIEGTEILCKKLDNGQLSIGRTLKGEVLEVRTDSYYSSVGEDEFVLYVKNDSPLKTAISGTVSVGDIFEIAVEETIEDSKQYTEKANAALVAQYRMIRDGVYNPAAETIALDHYNSRAQRSVIGLKSDGSVVLFTTAGRNLTDNSPGLTIPELGEVALQLGCVTAYNLDGGGSTQMLITDQNGDFEFALQSSEGTYGRNVANCIYIVERQQADPVLADDLTDLVNQADAVLQGSRVSATKLIGLINAYNDGAAVLSSQNSMPGDYTRTIMALNSVYSAEDGLNKAIAEAEQIGFRTYNSATLEKIWAAYDNAIAVVADSGSLASDYIAALYDLETALALTGTGIKSISRGLAYSAPTADALYPDTNGYELTDGVKSGSSADDSIWTGFNIANPSGTSGGRKYIDIVLDLDKLTAGIRRISTTMLNYSAWDAGAATEVKVFVSDNGSIFTEFGNATLNAVPQSGLYQEIEAYFDIPASITTRYIRFRYFFTDEYLLISEIEAYSADAKLNTGLYLTGSNEPISNDASILYTPAYAATLTEANANLAWATVVVCDWDIEKAAYIVTSVSVNEGAMADVAVPDNGFVLGVHYNSESSAFTNKAYASSATVGKQVNLNGIDLGSAAFYSGAYITFSDYSAPQVFFSTATISVDTAVIGGVSTAVISGISEMNTVYDIMHQFRQGAAVRNAGGQLLTSDDYVGTGAVITSGGKSYTVIVNGDTSGDGRVTSVDYLRIKRAFLETYTLEGAFLAAACVSGSDNISSVDYLMVKRHFLGNYDLYV